MTGEDPISDAEVARRFDRLSRELANERREQAEALAPERSSDRAGYGLAFKLAGEFVAGIMVGAGLGWGLDKVAGTAPFGMIVLLLLGFAAGVLNVVRSASKTSTAVPGGD